MKIVFIGDKNAPNLVELQKELEQLGQEVFTCPSKKIPLIPFKLRIGDVYFYCGGRILGFVMGVCEKLLIKPVININKMPKGDVYVFEKKCYKEYARYFR